MDTITITLPAQDARMLPYYLRIAAALHKSEAEANGIGPAVYVRRMERWRHADKLASELVSQVGYGPAVRIGY